MITLNKLPAVETPDPQIILSELDPGMIHLDVVALPKDSQREKIPVESLPTLPASENAESCITNPVTVVFKAAVMGVASAGPSKISKALAESIREKLHIIPENEGGPSDLELFFKYRNYFKFTPIGEIDDDNSSGFEMYFDLSEVLPKEAKNFFEDYPNSIPA